MVEKESALRSAGTDSQGSNQIDGVNLLRESNNVKSPLAKKSKAELDRQYLVNTFTRFKLQHYAQNKLLEREIIRLNTDYAKCHRATFGSITSLMRNPESSAHIITAWLLALMPSFVRFVLRELWESGEGR